MRSTRAFVGGLALSLAFVAGCGGGVTVPSASSVAPKDAAAYLSVDSTLDSPQWKQAVALIGRFPAAQQAKRALDQVRPVRAALGDRVDFVWLDLANGGRDVVVITKPKDPLLSSLLRNASNPSVSTEIDGWTVMARDQATLSAFEERRAAVGGSLDGDSAFKDAFRDLPDDALVQAFVRGSAIQSRINAAIAKQAPVPGFTPSAALGTLDSLGAAVIPQPAGLRLQATASGDFKGNPSTFHPELPSQLPAGALAYVSFSNLEGSIRHALDRVGQFVPNFDQARAQFEAQLGFSLDRDLLPLFGGEGAIAVYPVEHNSGAPVPVPMVDFVLKVGDEAAAHRVIDSLTSLGEQSGKGKVTTTEIAGVQATQVAIRKDVSLYVTAFGGKVVVTNNGAAIEALQRAGSKLADDPVYKAAVQGSDLPHETSGFLYANLQSGLGYAFNFAEQQQGQPLKPEVLANTEPLRGLLLYTSKHGGHFDFNGFLGIG